MEQHLILIKIVSILNALLLMLVFLSCNSEKINKKQIIDSYKRSSKKELQNSLNKLEEKTIEIDLEYFGMMCPCPQWARPEDIDFYNKSLESQSPLPMDSLFMILEPENAETINPFDLEGWENQNEIIFTFKGRFYSKKHYWVGEDGASWYCRKFQYESCKLKKKHRN